MRVTVIYATDSGNTRRIAEQIASQAGAKVVEISSATKSDFEDCDLLILGTPTCGYGDLQCDWDTRLSILSEVDLTGRKVALFGLGDQTPIPQFVTSAVTKMLFRSAVISEVVHLSGHFRLIQLEGDELREVAWVPGQKIQVHLGDLECRTYTPIEWNSVEGRTRIVAFLHGNGPGSEWASSVKPGTLCQFIGPRASLDFTASKGRTIFFGDETSIGAAVAHQRSSNYAEWRYLFEVSSLPESQEVIERLGLKDAKLIAKLPGAGHLFEVERLMMEADMTAPAAHWIFTGNAQSIQELKKALRNRHLAPTRASAKAYWAYGKKGLD